MEGPYIPFEAKCLTKRPPLPQVANFIRLAHNAAANLRNAQCYTSMRAVSAAPASSSCALPRRTCLSWRTARKLFACTRVSSRRAARAIRLTIARCIIADSSGVQRFNGHYFWSYNQCCIFQILALASANGLSEQHWPLISCRVDCRRSAYANLCTINNGSLTKYVYNGQ